MGTKTISLTEEAYEKLRASKKEGESFSEVVERIAPGVRLEEYWGILDDEAADELRDAVAETRKEWTKTEETRQERIMSELNRGARSDPDRSE